MMVAPDGEIPLDPGGALRYPGEILLYTGERTPNRESSGPGQVTIDRGWYANQVAIYNP